MKKLFFLFFVSISAGLLAGGLLLWINSGKTGNAIFPASGSGQGPVSYADAVERAAPSVVNIYTSKLEKKSESVRLQNEILRRFFGYSVDRQAPQSLNTSLGSGVIIREDGLVLTNNHIIANATQIEVVLADGQNVPVHIVGSDPSTDLALLKIDATGLPVMPVANDENLRVGDVVMAIGNPFGVGQTVTQGIISGLGRHYLGLSTFENFIQTDAAINPGNSGGALINAHGELIGINAAIFSKTGGSQGIGFAIPSDLAYSVAAQLLEHGHVVRGWLGIRGLPVDAELQRAHNLASDSGILVTAVQQAGPASESGIRAGDIITSIGDYKPDSAREFLDWISRQKPGTAFDVSLLRGEQPLQTIVRISERPTGL